MALAIKFTPRGGRVGLAVARVGDDVRFTVSDTGPGIAPDELHLVFDRFWRSSKRDALGLGLGLYISKSIIEAHGGRIRAQKRSGGGARISFTLPGRWPPATTSGSCVPQSQRLVTR